MKLLLGLLVVVNLAVFYWISQQSAGISQQPLPVSADIPALQLLSETATPDKQPEDEAGQTRAAPDNQEAVAVAPEIIEKVITPRAVFLELSCYSMGPFNRDNAAKSAARVLSELGLETTKQKETRNEFNGFWVYIPPLPNSEDALKVIEMLKDRGVKDHLIVRSGLNKNAISLGFFSTRETAEQHQAHMRALGLAPAVEEFYRESSGFWLDFVSSKSPPLPPKVVEAIQAKYDDILVRKRQCS